MQTSDLRIALFSGNYNYVRDGANQALNRLAGYLLRQGAAVRVYSPTVAEPAFEATGDLVSLPSIAFPGRGDYRFPLGLPRRIRRDLVLVDNVKAHALIQADVFWQIQTRAKFHRVIAILQRYLL